MQMHLKTFKKLSCLLPFLLSACAVGPSYKPLDQQELNIPNNWHATLPHNGSNIKLINWWDQFNDPTLSYFIKSSINNNPTLEQSVAKIEEAQANLKASTASFFPSLTATGSAEAVNNADGIASSSGDVISNTTGSGSAYTAGLNASWEIDLFGAIKHNTDAYKALLEASHADWNDARISLAAEVANDYVTARACQSSLAIYESEFASRNSTQKLTTAKVGVGFASTADGKQGAGLVAQTLSNLEQENGLCKQYQNELVAITGLSQAIIESQMKLSYAKIPLPKINFIADIPAKIISQRPDIASAERSVAAAMAKVGLATANRYPSLSLTGIISANGGTAYVGNETSWAFGPAISIPLFDAGYLSAQEDLAKAQYNEAVASYKLKVITAVKEVENALVRINAAHKCELAANDAVTNYQSYFDAMNAKYKVGWNSLLDLETARINLVSYQQDLTSAKLEEVSSWIALYKAVGGDWVNTQNIIN